MFQAAYYQMKSRRKICVVTGARAEYDLLFRELIDLENKFPKLIASDSPTQRVGSKLSQGFEKVEHTTPMLSLDNAFDNESLKEFERRIVDRLQNQEIQYQYILDSYSLLIEKNLTPTKFIL